MCTCIAEIKETYTQVRKQAEHVVEQSVDLFRQAKSDFDELCHDMKTFNIDLAQNEHFQQTLKMVSEMMGS